MQSRMVSLLDLPASPKRVAQSPGLPLVAEAAQTVVPVSVSTMRKSIVTVGIEALPLRAELISLTVPKMRAWAPRRLPISLSCSRLY